MPQSDPINPYAPPADITEDRPQVVDGLRYLRAPALGLLMLSALCAACGVGMLPMLVFSILLPLLFPDRVDRDSPIGMLLMFPMFAASYPIVFGAWNMRQGKRYRWAYAAAVLACIPVLSPILYFGIPLGIWALVVLHRRDVRAAFAQDR